MYTTKGLSPKLYLRKDKMDCEGRMPLFFRFPRIDGKEPKFSVGKVRLSLDEWDKSANMPKDEMLRIELEAELNRIKLEIHRCNIDNIPIDFHKLREIVKDEKPADPKNALFIDYYRDFLMKKEKGGLIRQSTIRSHISMMQALEEFKPKLRVCDIDDKVISRFVDFLKKRKCKSGKDICDLSFSKRLSQIRSVIRYIAAKGIPIQDPFKSNDIIIKPCGRNETYLNETELSQMVQLFYRNHLSIAERRILLMFLLACATGIRISDMRALQWRNINFDCRSGVIEFLCMKTQRKVYVPLSPMAGDILRYSAEDDINNVEKDYNIFVRVYSPTKINSTLKCLAKKAGISKNITFHVARRTFATLCREYEVPYYSIQSMLGHKPISVTERYFQWDTFAADKAAPQLSHFDLKRLLKLA